MRYTKFQQEYTSDALLLQAGHFLCLSSGG
nr:MAG TPA: hypothetical protein [Caudoviricetes sp.]